MANCDGVAMLCDRARLGRELDDLIEALEDRVSHVTPKLLERLAEVPRRVHARYDCIAIVVACSVGEAARVAQWQTGVRYVGALPAELPAFTPDQTGGSFSPTTRYRDCSISRDLILWEGQSVTRTDSETGRRYREHAVRGSHVLLFAWVNTDEQTFRFSRAGEVHPARRGAADCDYLESGVAAPEDLYQAFAVAVA